MRGFYMDIIRIFYMEKHRGKMKNHPFIFRSEEKIIT